MTRYERGGPVTRTKVVGAHEALNRSLATVALVLGILLMLAAVLVGVRLALAAQGIGDAVEQLDSGTLDTGGGPGVDCYDPGGGEVCVPAGD